MKAIACVLLLGVSSTAFALGQNELGDLKGRINEDKALGTLSIQTAIDVKRFSEDWRTNPARATIKYNKPNGYRGKLKRFSVRNGSDADLVFDAGDGFEVVAYLYPYQLGPWARGQNGKWLAAGGLTTMEFAALYDVGQEFLLTCNQSLPGQLVDCLVAPAEIDK